MKKIFLLLALMATVLSCQQNPLTKDLAKTAPSFVQNKGGKKLIAMDLDATITQHRTNITPEAKEALARLGERYDMVMVCAGNTPRVYAQLDSFPITILGNYGMQESVVENGEFKIIRQDTCPADTAFFMEKTNYLREKYGFTGYFGDPVEFHASGMVTFALLGLAATPEQKLVFDPDKSKRRAMYPEVCEIFGDKYSIYIGGSSSFDFAGLQYNKYDATMRYAEEHGYSKEEVIFLGDDFEDGGGDSHVRIKGLDYIHVKNYQDFPAYVDILLQAQK